MDETITRLSRKSLEDGVAAVARPAYDRDALSRGIVHLGIGAFHRAHQAVYTDDVLGQSVRPESLDWGIVGVSLRSGDTRDALAPQDGLYTLAVRDGDGDRLRLVGSITGLLVAPEDPGAVLAVMADPAIRIVSLTVTEKGYCHLPASGALDESHPDIIHDLGHPQAPRSAPGFIVEALRRRRAAGIAPFTVLSCDNLPENGKTLRGVVIRLAQLRDAGLGAHVAADVAFPSTMVDRIVPATTDADRAAIEAATGYRDAWPVVTEPFSQWVVEDRFPAGRPAWERAGVTFVEDVSAFELMKLRLLNGSHSTLAYLGYLAGHETVADAMRAEGFAAFVRRMMDEEITPTLPALPGFDVDAYKDSLIARFHNPALRHRLWQIAMDGSQKLPQRLLNTVRRRIEDGRDFRRLALGIAGWMRYAAAIDEKGAVIDVRDPLAGEIARITAGRTGAGELVEAYLSFDGVFGGDLPRQRIFRDSVEAALAGLIENGAAHSVAELADLRLGNGG